MVARRAMVLVLVVSLAACGGDDGNAAGTTAAAPDTSVAASDTSAPATGDTSAPATGDATITIQDFSFGDPLTVAAGTEVTVVNADSTTHTWTSDDDLFDEKLDAGATTSFTFDEAGTFEFHCNIHPSMTGSVTVEG